MHGQRVYLPSSTVWFTATFVMLYATTRCWLWQHASGFNASIYAYFADAVSVGRNPYTMPDGPVAGYWADYPPIWMALFGMLAKCVSGIKAVKLVTFAGDAALCVIVMRLAWRRVGLDRWATAALAVANPLYMLVELHYAQYKTVLAAGLTLLALEPSCVLLGALTGGFVLPAMLAPTIHRRLPETRETVVGILIAVASWAPYAFDAAPSVLRRRLIRASFEPAHESLLLLSDEASVRALVCVVGALIVAWLFSRRTVVDATAGLGVIVSLLPDSGVERQLAFTLPVLIVAEASGGLRLCAYLACVIGYVGTSQIGNIPTHVALSQAPVVGAVFIATFRIAQTKRLTNSVDA